MKFTASMQRYISVIYELSSHAKGVRVSDIADVLNVTKPSVCVAMCKLEKEGLVQRDASRLVFLTTGGEYQAILALDKTAIIRRFLTDVLDVKYEIADSDACAIERVISIEAVCSLCRFMNQKCREECHAKKIPPIFTILN